MEAYSLIARDKITNEVKIIPINERWYLGSNGRDIKLNKFSLEAIDLVTTRFPSASKMIEQMFKNGYINTTNVDLFIAKKIKKNDKAYIKTHEIIYNPFNKERIDDLKVIAFAYLGGQKESVSSLIDKVSNKLIAKANSNEDFRNILTCEMTDIPNRLTNAFWKGTQSYSLKYQNKQIFENYSTIRSIIEALNRYDYLSTLPGNPFVNNVDFLNENGASRKKIESLLLEILDKDYLPGQYSLFDDDYTELAQKVSIEEDNFQSNEKKSTESSVSNITNKKEENSSKEKEEREKLFEGGQQVKQQLEVTEEVNSELDDFYETGQLPEIPNISIEEKRKEIMQTFYQLPFSFLNFSFNRQNVKSDFFSNDCPLTSLEQQSLENLLPNSLALLLETYTAHKNEYAKSLANYGNTFLLEREIRLDEESISKKLKNTKELDKIYLWVLIYKRYLARLQEFENNPGKRVK